VSETSVKAREAAKRKVERLTTDPHQKVDASSWTPPEPEDADVQTGMRPVSPRQYKAGGKVRGEHEKARADRKARKSGGRAIAEAYMNRDMKEANQERNGTKHVGGMKRGGRAKRDMGGNAGDMVPTSRMSFQNGPSQMSRSMGLKEGGRAKRASGGGLDGALGILPEILMGKKSGGSVSDGTLEGTRPQKGGRFAHASGGRADAHWIKGAIKHPGALHRELNVADDKRISEKKLAKAEHSPNKLVAKRAHLAETLRGMDREGRKHGGKTGKGKMSVNIIIAPGGGGQPQGGAPMAGPPMPPPHPIVPPPMPQGAPPGGMPPGVGGPPPMMPPGAGMPPGGPPPPMMRRYGGSVTDKLAAISAGAGGGLARLVKARSATKSW
jgi:hypothetical protein